ncbi:class I SAM-dependent methyltransferase [Cryptosporangium aurantiacum]|uniref:class I SAM-dependent methyltransferase n=1 Tax=Cryptosporangium aurantiacum TaxID=134849 RepID=UPI001C4A483B|nr:class I SAM-dependent methyltransferase [Cryptosporangium aurantiacum]
MELTLTGERTLPGIAAENYWFRRHEVAYLAAHPWVRGATVLEAGAGEGYGADILSRAARRVIAVDYDAAACEHAAKAYPKLSVVRANLVELPLAAQSVDIVVNLQVIEHLWDQPRFLAECARVLRPAGTLILSTPNRLTFSPGLDAPVNPFHTRELSAAELTELLEPHFRVDRMYGVHHRGRLRRLDRRYANVVAPVPSPGGIVAAQFASPPATWHPRLRQQVAAVTHRDFTFNEKNVDGSLDLFAVAIRR